MGELLSNANQVEVALFLLPTAMMTHVPLNSVFFANASVSLVRFALGAYAIFVAVGKGGFGASWAGACLAAGAGVGAEASARSRGAWTRSLLGWSMNGVRFIAKARVFQPSAGGSSSP